MDTCVKQCPTGKICNPPSGRCVNKEGKTIKKSRSRSSDKCIKKACSRDKICNSKTSRCVEKNGKIGKQLILNSDKNRVDFPDIKHSYGPSFNKFIRPGYHLIKKLGNGSFGEVFLACGKDKYTCRAYKVARIKKNEDGFFELEVKMQQKFAKIGMAPILYKSDTFVHKGILYGAIEMDRVSGTLDKLLEQERSAVFLDKIIDWVLDLIDFMCKNKLIHGDFHWGNIAYNLVATEKDIMSDKMALQLLLIDFGWSCCVYNAKNVQCIPSLELSQLLRTLSISDMNKKNEKYLKDKLLKIYRKKYNSDLKNNIRSFDNENNELFEDYQDNLFEEQFKYV